MPQDLLVFWLRARDSEFGLALTTSHPDMHADLYAARKAANDPSLDNLMITKMANGEHWIVKKDVQLEDDNGPALT